MQNRNPNAGHRERVRERLFADRTTVQDYEVLELFLGYVYTRKDTKPIARALLDEFKTIRGVLDAMPEQLETVPEIGPGFSNLVAVTREIMARYAQSAPQKEALCTPEAVASMALGYLGGKHEEELWIAAVDNQNRKKSWARLARGSADSAQFDPRKILEHVFKYKATGFFLVHNHPGGSTEPSLQDIQATQKIRNLANSMNIRLLDHLIVGDGACYSICTGKLVQAASFDKDTDNDL